MNDIAIGASLAFLLIMQWFLVWECIKMKTSVGEHSTDIKTEMGTLGSLLDEALDFISDLADGRNQPAPVIAQTGADLKETLLTAFMSKMLMPSEYAPQESQEWPVHQDEPSQNEKEELQHQ